MSTATLGWRRWAPWLAMLVLAVPALAVAAIDTGDPATPADRVHSLSEQIQCPQCAGQSVAESDVAVSREIRQDIARRVEEGQTDDQIRAYYASSFGEEALLMPSASGVTGLVWALPVAAGVAALIGLAMAFRRWSGAGEHHATDEDRELVARALDDEGNAHDAHDADGGGS